MQFFPRSIPHPSQFHHHISFLCTAQINQTHTKSTMSTPSENTRLAKKQALLEDAATTPSANEEGAAATKTLATAKSATKKPKGTPKKTPAGKKPGSTKKTPKAKKEEETTETAVVAANSGSVNIAEAVEKMRAMNKASAEKRDENAKALAKRQTKLEKDQSKLKKTVHANHQWTKDQFAAQSKQNKEFAAQFKTQDEKIATIREDQEGTQSDLTRLGMAVVGLGNTMQGGLQSIKGLSDSMVGAIRLFDARTQANRNFASTAAFFAIVLAIVLGHYLLATTFLAITLGFYFVKNLYKK